MKRGAVLFCMGAAALLMAMLALPETAAQAAREALALCGATVIPSLFPFFVLASLLIGCGAGEALAFALAPVMGPLFSLSGAGAAALALGLCGGYPVGARTAAELVESGALSREEGERLLSCCNNAGPGFILGICGAVFHSPRAGAALYLIHAAGALLAGMALLRRLPPVRGGRHRGRGGTGKIAAAFPAAVQSATASCLAVCAYVVFFRTAAGLALHLLPGGAGGALPGALALGLLELTSGVTALPNSRGGFLLCAALLGWGGVSVHCQTASALAGSGLSMRYYWRGKILQAALSPLLALPALPFLFPR